MAKLRTLKSMLEKLQRRLGLKGVLGGAEDGSFVVYTSDGNGGLQRFIVGLESLEHPDFQRLLDKAAAEFGYKGYDALILPCRPSDLQRILGDLSKAWAHSGGVLARKAYKGESFY